MKIEIGRVSSIFRYPVKSMAGTLADVARLGWHGLEGDRRFAFRRLADSSGFPWLTAGRFSDLLLYQPFGMDERAAEPLPTHVRTPKGLSLELRSESLREDISERFGSDVELMQLNHGIFDEASISVISPATIKRVENELGFALDVRRFRPNILIETNNEDSFAEDTWVGGTMVFGADDDSAAINITMKDKRCSMINLDPDTAVQNPDVMKTVVRLNQNNAGIYGTVVRTGEIRTNQSTWLIQE